MVVSYVVSTYEVSPDTPISDNECAEKIHSNSRDRTIKQKAVISSYHLCRYKLVLASVNVTVSLC